MSRTTDYLDKVKQIKGLTSNYQLSKVLEIYEQDISRCYQGKKHADEYISTRIALALGIEPVHVMAEVRAEAEKNQKKREFWLNFLRHAAVVSALVPGLLVGLGYPNEASASTASAEMSVGNDEGLQNAKLCAVWQKALAALRGLASLFRGAHNFGALSAV